MLDAVPNTIMVLKTQGQVNMPWIDKVRTLVEAWYPGQEDGNVVADALFGVTNFSGKLPVTFGKTDREAAYASQEQYPGYEENTGVDGGYGRDPIPGATQRVVRYTEGLKMGYRWYQATGTKPLFPFGYGLSYTKFDYGNLDVTRVLRNQRQDGLRISYTVKNTGDVAGAEASQVYLRLPSEARESFNRLVQFRRVDLQPGQSKRVSRVIRAGDSNHPLSYFLPEDPDDLKRWADGKWVTPKGAFRVYVGGSSESTPLRATVPLNIGKVVKTPSRITNIKVTPKRVTPTVRARLTFRVRSGGRPARGKVVVRDRGSVVGRDTLSARGVANVRLKRLSVGVHRLRIAYNGSAVAAPASTTYTLRVRRR